MIQDAANARAQDRLAKIEGTLARLGERIIGLMQQYMTGEQVARIVTMPGKAWVNYDADYIQGEFDFDVAAGSTEPMNETFRRQSALQLVDASMPFLEMGVANPMTLYMHILQKGFGIKDAQPFLMQQEPPQAPGMEQAGAPPSSSRCRPDRSRCHRRCRLSRVGCHRMPPEMMQQGAPMPPEMMQGQPDAAARSADEPDRTDAATGTDGGHPTGDADGDVRIERSASSVRHPCMVIYFERTRSTPDERNSVVVRGSQPLSRAVRPSQVPSKTGKPEAKQKDPGRRRRGAKLASTSKSTTRTTVTCGSESTEKTSRFPIAKH